MEQGKNIPRLRQMLLSMPMAGRIIQDRLAGDILTQQVGSNRRQFFRHIVSDFPIFELKFSDDSGGVSDISWGGIGINIPKKRIKGLPYARNTIGILKCLDRFCHLEMDVRFSTPTFTGCQLKMRTPYAEVFLRSVLLFMDSGVATTKHEVEGEEWPDGWELYRNVGANVFIGLHSIDNSVVGGCMVFGTGHKRCFSMINAGYLDYGSDMRVALSHSQSVTLLRQSVFLLIGFYQRSKLPLVKQWVEVSIAELKSLLDDTSRSA